MRQICVNTICVGFWFARSPSLDLGFENFCSGVIWSLLLRRCWLDRHVQVLWVVYMSWWSCGSTSLLVRSFLLFHSFGHLLLQSSIYINLIHLKIETGYQLIVLGICGINLFVEDSLVLSNVAQRQNYNVRKVLILYVNHLIGFYKYYYTYDALIFET